MRTNLFRQAAMVIATLLISWASRGQDAGVITLYGHVSDAGTSESLFFASVNLAGTNISNVSNSDGFFSLKVPESTSGDAELLVSHLGYKTGSVKVSEFAGSTAESPLQIRLTAAPLQLDPATVRSIEADILFRSAFYKIKDNYPTSRLGMTAFYREMVRKGSTKYLVLNEAVIDIDKAPYTGITYDRVGIYKGRGSINYDSSDTLFVKLQGGISTALELDQVKNPFAGIGLDEAMKSFLFSMEGVETYDGHTFYAVGFRPRDGIEDILFKGTVYIEVETLAIGRVEMSLDIAGREEEAARIFIIKRPQSTRFYVNKADYVISYKCYDGKWYYDYCRADVGFTTRRRNSLFRNNYSITEEMAVTDHKAGGIAIDPAVRVKFKDILSERVADFADPDFWEDYNIIEPDQSIDAIIKRIVRQLGRRER